MGIDLNTAELIINLKFKGLFKSYNSVIDMGDQNFGPKINTEGLREINNLFSKNSINLEKKIEEYEKNYNNNFLSSSFFWKILGFKNLDRLDMFFEDRNMDIDPVTNKFTHDLNFKVENNKLKGQYDLVTDFGNNEHAFNVSNAVQTMHELSRKDGVMIIKQQIFNSNGFYNFTLDFFENLAAYNDYEINFSRLIFEFKGGERIYTSTNIKNFDHINQNNLKEIDVIYIFRKTKNEEFRIPYQRIKPPKAKNLPIYEYNFHGKSYPFEREYVYKDLYKIEYKELMNHIFKRTIKKFKRILGDNEK